MTGQDTYEPQRVAKAGAFEKTLAANPSAGRAAVRAMVEEAQAEEADRARLANLGRADPKPGTVIDGKAAGEWTPDEYGLPPDCPVLPLGTDNGHFSFLDTIGQLRTLADREMAQAGLNALFMGRHLWLYHHFPKTSDKGGIVSWRPEKVRETLMLACARKGAWSAESRVRGRGFWRGGDGRLLFHAGDRLISSLDLKKSEALGEREGFVYPTRPSLPKPWPVDLSAAPGPALKILPHFQKWNWRRPDLDPVLLLGQIGVMLLGGALEWRSHAFIMGDQATGKSSLQRDISAMLDSFLMSSGDTTAAGVFQTLKYDCLPVAIDEFEAKEDMRKVRAVLELSRLSSDGKPMNRGGESHKATQFFGRAAYLLSAINAPAMEPQDRGRYAMLVLRKLPAGQARPRLSADEWRRLGRMIIRKLFDNWHRWDATLERWRDFMAECGHDGRGQDTFGTLMACADMIIDRDAGDLRVDVGPLAEDLSWWKPLFDAASLAEFEQRTANWHACLSHLLGQRVEAWRGGTRHTVGEVLTDFWEGDVNSPDWDGFDKTRRQLEQTGLSLLRPRDGGAEGYELLIPLDHPLLHALFKGSKWQGEMTSGGWSGALRSAPAEIFREASGRFDGVKKKGTAFRLAGILVKREEAET